MKVNLLQRGMPISEGKKVENITAKVNAEQKALFEEVSRKEDRTVSYIVRELALRGLAQYQKDGRLRLTEDDETTHKCNIIAVIKVNICPPFFFFLFFYSVHLIKFCI